MVERSGNVLADGTNTYAWNAESEIKTAAGVNYTYDGDGNRVQKSNGKIYWYGAGTEILDESDASGNFTDEYVYFGGKRIAHRVVSGNSIYYYAEDFLGTSRVMTTSTGTICYDADFYPFGGERIVTNTCAQNYKFEGKERDAETSNDDFGARYYSSQFGRWTSPDWSAIPVPVPYANLNNPQTLNLYAMVRDNPETFADLDGHILQLPDLPGSLEQNGTAESTTAQPAPTTPGPPPPVPVPGHPELQWEWHPDGKNTRKGTWGPKKGTWDGAAWGSPPSATQEGNSHWDVDSGKGGKEGRQRYDLNGKPVTPDQAHGMSSIISNARDFVSAHPVATRVVVGVIIVGGLAAAVVLTGGTGVIGAAAAAF